MVILSTFIIGFSLIIALTLFISYLFFIEHVNKNWISVCSSAAFLIALSLAQFYHYGFYTSNTEPLSTAGYRYLIFLIPPLFYFFSRAILFPDRSFNALHLMHFSPVLIALFAPREIAVAIAFIIGTGYCFWLTRIVYKLKTVRKGFGLVFYLFSFFSFISIIILVLGLVATSFETAYFYFFYTFGIGFSFILITATLIVIPNLLNEIDEVVRLGYSNSTLSNVDIKRCLDKLESLMCDSKMYQNDNLSLAVLSREMALSNHQLSELINTHFGLGFSHYIRVQRIKAAKHLLKAQQNASILSISMEVGFKSQSNFYAAFKDITGQSPGNFRKSATY